MIIYKDPIFNFTEIFNQENGILIRTGILDENGNDTKIDSKMRAYPELIDIGIMGKCHVANKYCKEFGVDCYQGKNNYCSNMKLDDFKNIVNESKGKTLQVALGGRGDPNKHENFEEILRYTRENNIVPNLTTTGVEITESEIQIIKKYCGAVAISMYSKLLKHNNELIESNDKTIAAIKKLIERKVITNIHYVISTKTIDDIILRLENNLFPIGINAVIFLLYKPVGLASEDYVIRPDNEKLKKFFDILNKRKFKFKIGFDTCFSPLVSENIKGYSKDTMEFCEASRFSCYISPTMQMSPCSFIQNEIYAIDLKQQSIQKGWLSDKFSIFRNYKNISCENCELHSICDGGCANGLNQKSCCKK